MTEPTTDYQRRGKSRRRSATALPSQESSSPEAKSGRPRTGVSAYWFLLAASLLLLFLAAYQFVEQRLATKEAQSNLQECEQIVQDIASLKGRPKLATSNLGSSQDISQRIAMAMERSGIPSNSVQSNPSPVARIGLSDYRERLTRLEFQGVSLPDLVVFENQIREGSGLTVSELAIYAPTRAESRTQISASNRAEIWNARLTLTELIYSPTSPP